MLSRDYISRIIRTFFETLDALLNGKKDDEMEIQEQLSDLYRIYFEKDRELFLNDSVENMVDYLKDDAHYIQKCEMLAELMYRDGGRQTDDKVRANLFRKVIFLYELIHNNSTDYSLVYMNRLAELQRLLGQEACL